MRNFDSSRLLLSVIMISFLLLLGSAVAKALRPIYFVEMGATHMQLGLLMALPSLVMLLFRVPAIAVSYRLGRWRMMISSIGLSVFSTTLFAFARDPIWFIPIVSAIALAWAVFSAIAVEYVSSLSTSTTRGGIMGLYYTSHAAALFVGPFIASILTVFLSLRQLFLVSAVFPVVSLAVFLLIVKPSEVADYELNLNGRNSSVKKISGSFSRIFRNSNFVSACITMIAWSISVGIFSTVYPIFAGADLELSPSLISLLFTFMGVTNVFIRIPSGRLSDKIGRRKPFILAYAIAIVVFILLAFVRNYSLLIIVMVFYGVGWGMRIAPSVALVSESVKDEDRPIVDKDGAINLLTTYGWGANRFRPFFERGRLSRARET
jgi:MFS family permease